MEQELIDRVIPKDGNAEDVGAIVQAMDIIDERRKQLFPKLRKLIVSYDLKFSDGRASLNIGWHRSRLSLKRILPACRQRG